MHEEQEQVQYARVQRRQWVSWPVLLIGLFVAIMPGTYWYLRVSYLFFVPVSCSVLIFTLAFVATRERIAKSAMVAAISLALIGFVAPPLILALAIVQQPDYEFVLPTGYRGGFKLIVDKKNGVEPKREGGKLVYVIPQSGVLKIRDDNLMGRYRTDSVRYADGTAVASSLLHPLGIQTASPGPEKSFWWFIGTGEEFRLAEQSFVFELGGVGG